jgi:hypothetical protein
MKDINGRQINRGDFVRCVGNNKNFFTGAYRVEDLVPDKDSVKIYRRGHGGGYFHWIKSSDLVSFAERPQP